MESHPYKELVVLKRVDLGLEALATGKVVLCKRRCCIDHEFCVVDRIDGNSFLFRVLVDFSFLTFEEEKTTLTEDCISLFQQDFAFKG